MAILNIKLSGINVISNMENILKRITGYEIFA